MIRMICYKKGEAQHHGEDDVIAPPFLPLPLITVPGPIRSGNIPDLKRFFTKQLCRVNWLNYFVIACSRWKNSGQSYESFVF
jgi:hypothetical protein